MKTVLFQRALKKQWKWKMNQEIKRSSTEYTLIPLLSKVGPSGVWCHQNGEQNFLWNKIHVIKHIKQLCVYHEDKIMLMTLLMCKIPYLTWKNYHLFKINAYSNKTCNFHISVCTGIFLCYFFFFFFYLHLNDNLLRLLEE